MEAEGKKNVIYISKVANVPYCTSYSGAEQLSSDKDQQLCHPENIPVSNYTA